MRSHGRLAPALASAPVRPEFPRLRLWSQRKVHIFQNNSNETNSGASSGIWPHRVALLLQARRSCRRSLEELLPRTPFPGAFFEPPTNLGVWEEAPGDLGSTGRTHRLACCNRTRGQPGRHSMFGSDHALPVLDSSPRRQRSARMQAPATKQGTCGSCCTRDWGRRWTGRRGEPRDAPNV